MILTKENISSINIDSKTDDYVQSGRLNEILFIVPTNRKVRSFKKELIDLAPEEAVSKLNIETLTTISEKLLSQIENFIPLSEAASTVLIKQSAASVKLNYLVNYKDEIPFGTLDRIKNVISEYKRNGIYPDKLRDEAENLDYNEKAKTLDIAKIYDVYLQKCFELNALEIGDIYFRLNAVENEKFIESFATNFPGVKFVLINGFDELTSLEVDIIGKIADTGGTELYLNFDYFVYNPLIFSHLDKCYNNLERKGFKRIEDRSSYVLDDFRKSVRENLFVKTSKTIINNYEEKIGKLTGRNIDEEIELIAKEIKELILIHSAAPHDICVVFNLINEYSARVRDIFDSYGIPVNLTDRISLDNSHPVIALINFLEIAENDFYYKNLFRALSSKYLNGFDIDVSNLNLVASELKIVSGYDNWMNSINEKIQDLEKRGSEDYYSLTQEDLKGASHDLQLIKTALEPFDKKQTIEEFHRSLREFISRSNLGTAVLEDGDNSERNIKGLTTFIEVTEELLALLQLEHPTDNKFGLGFYLDQIKTACSWARFNTKERSDLGVTVTSVNEIRGLTYDYLFIGGMNDGIFPTRFNPEIFFAGSFAKKDHIHQTEERYHFYQALCAWKKKLYLSHSLMDAEKEMVDSTFLSDFESTFNLFSRDWQNFKSTLYNRQDLLINLGKDFEQSRNRKIIELVGKEKLNKIRHKIDVEELRVNEPFSVSPFNGYIGAAGFPDKTDDQEFSISQLETYAKCPFKYFSQYILKLSQIEEPSEELEAVEIGSLLHGILFQFYMKLRERGIVLQHCKNEVFEEAESLLFKIAEENLSSPVFNSELAFFEKERILGIGGNRKQSILYKFLENERDEQSGFLPSFFEVVFGSVKRGEYDPELSDEQPLEYENVKLRGKIDRIDIADGKKFNVIDYKLSGKKPSIDDINKGISLQLPVYFYAAESLLHREMGSVEPSEMLIYSLKYKESDFGKKKVTITSKRKAVDLAKLTRETVDVSLRKIKEYVAQIGGGEFPLTSLSDREKKICGYCNFKEICRIEETEL